MKLPSHGYYHCIGLKHLSPCVQPYKFPTWKILEVFHYPQIPISISDTTMRCSKIYFLTFQVELKPLKITETYMRLKKCDAKQKSPEIKFTNTIKDMREFQMLKKGEINEHYS